MSPYIYSFCSIAVFLFAAQTAGAAPLKKTDVFKKIDEEHAQGRISFADRIYYKVAAVRAPELLPERFRQVIVKGARNTTERVCTAPVLHEGYKALKDLPQRQREQVQNLLLPPPDLTYVLDATQPYPFRVSYSDPGYVHKAQLILNAAITSYNKEVTEWGFWEPPIEPGAEFYRIFLQSTGSSAGGYCSPYTDVPNTPRSDSYSYIVIDTGNTNDLIPITVAHEFNHACQLGMDALEVTAFLENTATYIEGQVFPDDAYYTILTFSYFQAQPFRPLEYMNMGQSDLYEYGGSMWVWFLEYMYGNEDPAWIRQVWEGSVQADWMNEPDYFDVLDNMLQSHGGLTEAVKVFSRYRFFVGTDDDGQHFPDAHTWFGTEVEKTATWSISNLPFLNLEPPSETRPQPNGCNYIVLEVNRAAEQPVRFSFSGDADLRWNVDLIKVAAEQDTTYEQLEVDAEGSGKLTIDVSELDQVVMVVCQLSGDGYDPDARQWTQGKYTYSIQYEVPPPEITSVTPDRFAPGAHNELMIIRGSGFMDLHSLEVALSGDKVRVELQEHVSSEELHVRVFVAPGAELGPRDVVVINPDGTRGVGEEMVSIVDPSELVDAGPDGGTGGSGGSSGCGCRGGSSGGSFPALLIALLALALIIRPPWRRGRCGFHRTKK